MINKVISFIVGWFRYWLYYTFDGKGIRPHIKEQIGIRITSMNIECYQRGSCIKCGCATTALQMANKPCKGFCYPRMLSKRKWKQFKQKNKIVVEDTTWILTDTLQFKREEDEL